MTKLCDVFLSQGESGFRDVLRSVSMSRLRTFQIYEHIKVRTRLVKLNSENLRKAAPKLWARLSEQDEDLAADLSQAILVSHLDMIIEALNLLGVPHQDGFFAKETDVSSYLSEGWQQRAYDALKDKYPPAVLHFYLNHLAAEVLHSDEMFTPQ